MQSCLQVGCFSVILCATYLYANISRDYKPPDPVTELSQVQTQTGGGGAPTDDVGIGAAGGTLAGLGPIVRRLLLPVVGFFLLSALYVYARPSIDNSSAG